MSAAPSISVVAPTYRRRDGLARFVEPLLRQQELRELVMAVDGSDDGSVEWLEERRERDPRLVVLDLPNRGAGATRQSGIEAATGDVVLLLDDDVIAPPGLVAGHARHHRDLERKLVLGYMPNEWRHLPPGRRGIGFIYRRWYEMHCERYVADPDFVLEGLFGGNLSLPRDEFVRIRIDRFPASRGQDDRDFGVRCKKAGIRGVFDAGLRAEHLYERTIDQYRGDCRMLGLSKVLIKDRHMDILGEDAPESERSYPRAWDEVGTGLPRSVRTHVWPTLARDPFFGQVTRGLMALFEAGVKTRHLGLEVQAARALGSLEAMRGVLDAPEAVAAAR